MRTLCEELGYRIGDSFELQKDVYTRTVLTIGSIVTLCLDDGTDYPNFRDTNGLKHWIPLEFLQRCDVPSPGVKVYPESPNKNVEPTNESGEVDHPAHYNSGKMECIDAIESALSPEEFKGYLKGNTLKYLWRMNLKGSVETDAKKAKWYLDKLLGTF
jgi:hypothetical protein